MPEGELVQLSEGISGMRVTPRKQTRETKILGAQQPLPEVEREDELEGTSDHDLFDSIDTAPASKDMPNETIADGLKTRSAKIFNLIVKTLLPKIKRLLPHPRGDVASRTQTPRTRQVWPLTPFYSVCSW